MEAHPLLHPKAPEPFVCVSCEREQCMRWVWYPKDFPVPPLCDYCRREFGKTPPAMGALRDRKIIQTLYAVTEVLETESNRMIWEVKHGW